MPLLTTDWAVAYKLCLFSNINITIKRNKKTDVNSMKSLTTFV